MSNKPIPAPELEPVDEGSISEIHELLDVLNAAIAESSSLDDQTVPEHSEYEGETTQVHEYILKPSALKETKSLEELADLATGSYKFEPPVADISDTAECYFHHTRKLKALQQDDAGLESIEPSFSTKPDRRPR